MAISSFRIMDRYDAIEYCKEEHVHSSIIISISSANGYKPRLVKTDHNRVVAVLYLFFDDEVIGNNTFSNEQAERIVRFVDAWKSKVERLVVHCDAGVSRSAAVCAAMKRYLGFDNQDIFTSQQYEPNPLVYETLIQQFL
jgi:protein-tyrosine phosphatase